MAHPVCYENLTRNYLSHLFYFANGKLDREFYERHMINVRKISRDSSREKKEEEILG